MSGSAESNAIAGQGVFAITYGMACAKRFKAEDDIKVDTTSVFSSMYQANKKLILKSDYYQEIAGKTVLEVIADENGIGLFHSGFLEGKLYHFFPVIGPMEIHVEIPSCEPSCFLRNFGKRSN